MDTPSSFDLYRTHTVHASDLLIRWRRGEEVEDALAHALREAQRLLAQMHDEVVRLQEDRVRLDWLDAEAVTVWPVAALTVKAGYARGSAEWVNCVGTAREAIDRARRMSQL